MKNALLHNWHIFRFLRLALGIAIIVQGAMGKDWLFILAGILFTLLALFNSGCCATGGCYPTEKKVTTTKKNISYEEVV
jgi:hypothetical protein